MSYEKRSAFVKELRKGAIFEKKNRVNPEIIDFGSGQGRSEFETGNVARWVEDFKFARTPDWAKICYFWMGTNYIIDNDFHSTLIDIICQFNLFGRIFNELESFLIGRRS